MLKIILDFDGTLTAEEMQAGPLAEKSIDTLASEIIGVRRDRLAADYEATQARLLADPYLYWWEVNGLVASYCDEGAFILNTTTLQTMLTTNPVYSRAVADAFPAAEYDPVMDCVNHLFHRHTAELRPVFRPAVRDVLIALMEHPTQMPLILTNSLGDKVKRHLSTLRLPAHVDVLGDTRQYAMDPDWPHRFRHPDLGSIQIWALSEHHKVDLRRPIYYRALQHVAGDGARLVVVADTFSLPGALPLLMKIPFFLLRTPYTPLWCISAVETHPLGHVLDDLSALPDALESL
jgi:hypothetical protein